MKKYESLVWLMAVCIIGFPGCKTKPNSTVPEADQLQTIQLPSSRTSEMKLLKTWNFEESDKTGAEYLFITPCVDNIDKGSPVWGTSDSRQFRLLGDYGGEFRIIYENSTVDTIPLVYGYTLWFKNNWKSGKEPFLSDSIARKLLNNTLFLNNIYGNDSIYRVRVRLRKSNILRIEYFDNLLKDGFIERPGFRFAGEINDKNHTGTNPWQTDNSDVSGFFASHTIDTINTYPSEIKNNLRKLMYLLYTFNADFENVKEVEIPADYKGPSIVFSGSSEANIISNLFFQNLRDQVSRVDTNGIVHESAFMAPSWFYDGFGTWTNAIGTGNNGSYYDCYYTRNKTTMLLPDLNYISEANRALALLDKQLMYFPELYPSLQLGGNKIPGHWTVIANKPLIYSQVLTGVGWQTQYTKKKFGSHYMDYGNPETDGHGHSMMSHWKTWQNSGRNRQWVTDRWVYLKEAADFLLWSLDNPDLSFSKYGLLYAESEAGMNDYTLYCNFPCYLGLLMYAEMADSIGAEEYAVKWGTAAKRLKNNMLDYFASDDSIHGKIWRKVGFFHENILMTQKEYTGFDLTGKLPPEWIQRSRNTYLKTRDVKPDYHGTSGHGKDLKPDYYGMVGLGYDHGIMTQTAMMLDEMDDVTKWMKNLAHLCYSPRLPKPFIVPECASVDVKRGIIRRQGDLGNGYQQAETVNSILLCAGVDDNIPGTLKIMPRLPEKWDMKISNYPAIVYFNGQSYTAYFDLKVTFPVQGEQTCSLKVISGGNLENVHFRLGPFPAGTKNINIGINGKKQSYACFESGDRSWAWVVIPEVKVGSDITLQTHN